MGQVLEAGPDRRQGGRAYPVSSFLACFPPPILSPSPRTLGLASASVLSLRTSPRGAPAPTSRGSEQGTWMVRARHSSSNSILPPPSLRFTDDTTEALGAGGGAVRDFRVTGLQCQSRAKSRISDVKVPLPALVSPQHAPPGPQHGLSIRNHSRQERSKGEPLPEPSALDSDARGLLVLVSLRPFHTAIPGPSPTKGSSTDHSRENPRVKHLQVWKKEPPNQGSLGPAGHRSLRDREGGKCIQEK